MADASLAKTTGADKAIADLSKRARVAASSMAHSKHTARNKALMLAAAALLANSAAILKANAQDMTAAQAKGVSKVMLDRLLLDKTRITGMAESLKAIAAQPDPLGKSLAQWQAPSGFAINRVSTPIGVLGVIFEARPNVTIDAAALAIKSGNAVILRGGSDSINSSAKLATIMQRALGDAGLPSDAVLMVESTDRAMVRAMLQATGGIDVIIPRGGHSLVAEVQTNARIPVFAHLDGICHVYIHGEADAKKAVAIAVNAKMRRVSVCGAMETLLVDASVVDSIWPQVAKTLADAGCELRCDAATMQHAPSSKPSQASDYGHEFLDAILAVKCVAGLDDAIAHINRYGSGHTDAIITEDSNAGDAFLGRVDSAITIVNASTQFADGGEFGMGAEIGIATGRIHARGPVGADQLTCFKYMLRGTGQTRP